MTNRFVKFAAAVAPAALLLAAGGSPANAKVLLMGDGGWEVSFDGSVNGFALHENVSAAPGSSGANFSTHQGAPFTGSNPDGSTDSGFRVRTGLLPAVWGMNVKAPTTGGLDMAARLGIYPNISNNLKNSFDATLDLREIFFTVDGSWGQVLVGKTLSQFLGKNILTDQTLFGIGAIGGIHGGGTTLGRIGFGYVYPQFNARIQYTTPDMSGFKVSAGMYDPSIIKGTDISTSAHQTNVPRFEGEASWAGALAGTTDLLWLSGMYQTADFSGQHDVETCASAPTNQACLQGKSVDVWGFAGGVSVGIPVGPGTLELMGSGYTGRGIGTTLQLDADSLDFTGQEIDNHGYIGQVGYGFGQGTKIQVSYGESDEDETSAQNSCRLTHGVSSGNANFGCPGVNGKAYISSQALFDVMVTHDVNPNLKLVAEYGHEAVKWFDSAYQVGNVWGAGAFFFW